MPETTQPLHNFECWADRPDGVCRKDCSCWCHSPKAIRCYFCRTPVPIKQHAQHMHVLDSLIFAEAEGWEDLFVHTVGPGDEFDAEGNVAACDRHFIEELVDNLKTPYDHPEWLDPVPAPGPEDCPKIHASVPALNSFSRCICGHGQRSACHGWT